MLWRGVLVALVVAVVGKPSDVAGAIAFVRAVGTAGSQTVGTTLTVAVGAAGVAADDTLIVAVALDPASGAVACADDAGNVYTVDADATRGSGTSGVRTVVCSARVTTPLAAGDTITVTHPAVAARAACAYEFAGISVADRSAIRTGSSTSPSAGPTAPTSQGAELLFAAVGMEAKKTDPFTPGAGFTVLVPEQSSSGGLSSASVAINAEYRSVAVAGAYSASGTIISHPWAETLVTYRAFACGNGVVEPAEQCDDGNLESGDCCDPSCRFEDASVVCRDAAGPCDVPEYCPGDSGSCPDDAKSTDVCRPAVDDCDVDEVCDGVADDCPPDALADAGTLCRDAAGDCDLPEYCTGDSASCPADLKSTDECRPAVDDCDVAEVCDGVSDDCPADTVMPDTDGDGLCDALDYCPSVADDETDSDGDGIPDACDPCTTDAPAPVAKPRLRMQHDARTGGARFKLSGVVTVDASPAIDPAGKGFRMILSGPDGLPVLDAIVAGGRGWTHDPVGHAWRYQNLFSSEIVSIEVRASAQRANRLVFRISGFLSSDPGPGVHGMPALVVIDAPYATTGQCGAAVFPTRR